MKLYAIHLKPSVSAGQTDVRRIIINIIPNQRQLYICEMIEMRLRYKILETVCNKGNVKLYRPLENCAPLRMGPIGCPETSKKLPPLAA